MKNFKSTLAYNWFEEVWNNGHEDLIDALIAPDCIAHGLTGENERGPEAFKKFYREFRRQYKDIYIDVRNVVTDKEFEVALCFCTAMHIGSGKTVSFSGQCMIKNEFGQVKEAWNNFDFLSMYQQLGFTMEPPKE